MPDWKSRFLVALILALPVTGCATRTPIESPPPEEPAEERPAPPPMEEQPSEPAPPPPPPAFDPQAFRGLSPREIELRLGDPELVRREGAAEVWQYVSGPCVLHLFFYPAAASKEKRAATVEYVEAKTRPGPWGDGLTPQVACAGEFSGR